MRATGVHIKKANQSRGHTAIDLFCGAGGLSAALERSGFSSVAAVDHDKDCIATLRRNQAKRIAVAGSSRVYLENTKLLQGDIREINRADLIPDNAPANWRPDILAGGPPCQPFSSAGSGLGLDDPRGQLFQHFVRLAEELQPRFILFENVAGLVTAKGKDGTPGGALKLIQQRFEAAGYTNTTERRTTARTLMQSQQWPEKFLEATSKRSRRQGRYVATRIWIASHNRRFACWRF